MQLHTSGRGMYLQLHTHARERDVQPLYTHARERDVHAATHSRQGEGCTCSYTRQGEACTFSHTLTPGREMYMQLHTHARRRCTCRCTLTSGRWMYMQLHTHARKSVCRATRRSRRGVYRDAPVMERGVQNYTLTSGTGMYGATQPAARKETQKSCMHTHVRERDVRSYTTRTT